MSNTSSGRRSITCFSLAHASGYVLSGCSQPMLVQVLRTAGLADAKAQLYMWFYYLGPALVLLPLFFQKQQVPQSPTNGTSSATVASTSPWPSRKLFWRAVGISLFDTVSASMNYAGASLAGPTIFAIVYSSVTIWTAIFSRIWLGRTMNLLQWFSVGVVFFGLTVTAKESQQGESSSVWLGCILVLVGSIMHAMTYIFCEAIMTVGEETLTLTQNCGIQANVACFVLGAWQVLYTIPHWREAIGGPMNEAGTTWSWALGLLLLFAFGNWVHSITFYETLIHFPGGATSAGVMKGLQAVLVFVFTHLAFCGKTGGEELCFTEDKFLSLLMVVGGVITYGFATQKHDKATAHGRTDEGYESIEMDAALDAQTTTSKDDE